jgi:hypothetical protein
MWVVVGIGDEVAVPGVGVGVAELGAGVEGMVSFGRVNELPHAARSPPSTSGAAIAMTCW